MQRAKTSSLGSGKLVEEARKAEDTLETCGPDAEVNGNIQKVDNTREMNIKTRKKNNFAHIDISYRSLIIMQIRAIEILARSMV